MHNVYSKEKKMDNNPPSCKSREDLLEQINVFQSNLKKYRELMSQEKDMFNTIKNSPDDFLEKVILLKISAIDIYTKLNDNEQTKYIEKTQLDHYKVMFKHYTSYFEIQEKTANTFLKLENSKNKNLSTIASMRNKYILTDSGVENTPKI